MYEHSSFDSLMANWNFQLFLWAIIFGLFLVLMYRVQKKKFTPEPLAKLNARFGPLFIGIIWMHRILFDVPKNLGAIYDESFFYFWFHPFRFYEYKDNWKLFIVLFAIGILLIYYARRINRKYFASAKGAWLPVTSLILWYLAGVSIAHTPDTLTWLMDQYQTVPEILTMPEVLLSFGVGMVFTIIAHILTRLTARKKEETSYGTAVDPEGAATIETYEFPEDKLTTEFKPVPLIADLPVLGDIVESIQFYVINTYNMIKSRSAFLNQVIYPMDDGSFKKSMKYFSTGLGVGFLFLVPFFVAHHQSASKLIFVLRQVVSIVLYSLSIHLVFLLVGLKKITFKSVCTPLGYVWGLLFPFNFVMLLPILIAIGPDFIFEANGQWMNEVSQESIRLFLLLGIFGGIVFIIIWLRYILPWFSKSFHITKGKLIGMILLAGLPVGLFIGFVLGPLFNYLEKLLGDWLMAV